MEQTLGTKGKLVRLVLPLRRRKARGEPELEARPWQETGQGQYGAVTSPLQGFAAEGPTLWEE